MTASGYGGREGGRSWFGGIDWGAIIAAVVSGTGVTILLVALGAALGIEAGDDGGDEGKIAAGIGTWTVVSSVIGTLVGSYIGGRVAREDARGEGSLFHALTSWGLATLLGIWLGSNALGLLGGALSRGGDVSGGGGGGGDAADAISWGGWALALGLLLNLIAAIIGWRLGSGEGLPGATGRMGAGGMGGGRMAGGSTMGGTTSGSTMGSTTGGGGTTGAG